MTTSFALLLVVVLMAMAALAFRAYTHRSIGRHKSLSRQRRASAVRKRRQREFPDGKRCTEIAGGSLDLMADYDVSHPYWYIAVEDD